jgi:hypothetical protein
MILLRRIISTALCPNQQCGLLAPLTMLYQTAERFSPAASVFMALAFSRKTTAGSVNSAFEFEPRQPAPCLAYRMSLFWLPWLYKRWQLWLPIP